MKYEVVEFTLINAEGEQGYITRALAVGDWRLHLAPDPEFYGVTVSHKSGMAASQGLTPVSAVRLVRELAKLPACPVDDAEFVAIASAQRIKDRADLHEWCKSTKRVIDEVVPILVEVEFELFVEGEPYP